MIRATEGMRSKSYFEIYLRVVPSYPVAARGERKALTGEDFGSFEPAGQSTPAVNWGLVKIASSRFAYFGFIFPETKRFLSRM